MKTARIFAHLLQDKNISNNFGRQDKTAATLAARQPTAAQNAWKNAIN